MKINTFHFNTNDLIVEDVEGSYILPVILWIICLSVTVLSGVEPEPFEMGEHLVEASGKLFLLDSILAYLHNE